MTAVGMRGAGWGFGGWPVRGPMVGARGTMEVGAPGGPGACVTWAPPNGSGVVVPLGVSVDETTGFGLK